MNTLSLNNLTLISSKLTQDAPLESILKEVQKLKRIRQIGYLCPCFLSFPQDRSPLPPTRINRTTTRTAPSPCCDSLHLDCRFLLAKSQEITDSLVELLVQIIHRLGSNAERRVEKQLIDDFKRVDGKPHLLFRIAEASLERPEELVKDVVYPVVSQKILQDVVKEYKSNGPTSTEGLYGDAVIYVHHYRRMVPQIHPRVSLQQRYTSPSDLSSRVAQVRQHPALLLT